jgi:beta-phosphoglucomutase-like phosphatase (HAD superfamily)
MTSAMRTTTSDDSGRAIPSGSSAELLFLPDLGSFSVDDGLVAVTSTSDGRFHQGELGVSTIASTRDGKVEFVGFTRHTLACVRSALGYPAYYPVLPTEVRKPLRAVLMDLDGTTVRSEQFWVWIIEQTTASLRRDPRFTLEEEDLPFVAGHSVSEHLQYCIQKYCPEARLEDARHLYFEHTHREMREVLEGRGRVDAFVPAPGLRDFLRVLKDRHVKLALVTSGLYEKAWPEIVAACRQLKLGDPSDVYDAIVTAGFPLRDGRPGTLGELSPKPHPWLYAEACRVGLGIPFEDRAHVVGVEDSGAGICSVRLAGFAPLGVAGGNLVESGVRGLCHAFCASLEEILTVIT